MISPLAHTILGKTLIKILPFLDTITQSSSIIELLKIRIDDDGLVTWEVAYNYCGHISTVNVEAKNPSEN